MAKARSENGVLPAGADKDELAGQALGSAAFLKKLVAALGGADRNERARAAEAVHEIACREPAVLKPLATELIDALDRPEVQTRWEILGALEELVAVDARLLDKALEPATVSLHDAESGVVRIAAFRMLAAYGATTARRAEKVWPLLDEAIRAYHGDAEYPAMLGAVVVLVEGAAPDDVRAAAAERFEADVTHPRTAISRRAKRVVARAPKGKKPKPKAE